MSTRQPDLHSVNVLPLAAIRALSMVADETGSVDLQNGRVSPLRKFAADVTRILGPISAS
jgi:hypothetical protein